MNINDVFPSKYLKAADLAGREIIVTMSRVEEIDIGQGHDAERKPCLYFEGKDKGVVLNKTNASVIAGAYGPETDGWKGKQVVLYVMDVSFQGQMVPAIRVRIPQEQVNPEEVPF